MNRDNQYVLPEVVDLFLLHRGIEKKKYFSRYLTLARYVWKDIFKNTLFTTQSVWQTVQDGDPFPYINIPQGAERIFSVSVEDECHTIVPLFYNNRINVVKKPTVKKCGCTECNCAGLCEDASSLQMTTKLIFTINGLNYYETSWIQTCKNGDVLLFTKTPVKKYNNTTGDAGDFNSDYNNDYSISSAPFSDYTIIYVEAQKKVCKLEVFPCGCPTDSQENQEIFNNCCTCFLNCCSLRKRKHCDDFLENPNNNWRGEVKISECNTKIYYKANRHWRNVSRKKIPDFLLINYQTSGETCDQDVLVPEYALDCMYKGMYHRSVTLKEGVPYNDKLGAKWEYEAEKNRVIMFMNPISLENLANIQDSKILW